ncbi:zinc-dependent peptidase [Reichenbachiella carrageenanivorans]|uniref:Zinc-dependent peptidase n=1 Tax=Reichenbachiella carrageenanivorans TaxID=2979869 RepID=A0ABY6D3G9_9BACT|nr:M90 family metallopeptidase [Reichenbachiella carrageenanivorans]UXX79653.1 zinc-dependent peptidase [Reichenbachiella carrageenanivorans]
MPSFTSRLFIGIIGFIALIAFVGLIRSQMAWLGWTIPLAGLSWWVWNKQKPRKKASLSFDPVWQSILLQLVPFYEALDEKGREAYDKQVINFFSTIKITAVDFEMDDECRLLVASSAIIPFWDLPVWNYGELQEVIVYSNHFNENYQVGEDQHLLGMVGNGGHMNHVMLLSKPALYQGFENKTNKNHVGFHEFAHLLDKSDGDVDGIPELFLPKELVNPWAKLVHREIRKIRAGKSDINPYGATSDAEFFAVISEYYHKRPKLLQTKHPDLYSMLELIYHPNGQDKH